MKTMMCFAVAAVTAGMACAQPEVSGVVVKGGTARRVRVQYALSEDAVVTPRFKVGGEWLSGERVTALSGDVCRKVAATKAGETRSFTWAFAGESEIDAATQAEVELTAWSTNAPPDYMTIALQSPYAVNYYADAASVPLGVTNALYKTTKMLLRKIPAAGVEWCMGAAFDKNNDSRGVGHAVVLTRDYYMAVYLTTQRQMQLLSGGFRSGGGSKTDENADLLPSNGAVMNNVRGVGATPAATSYIGKFIALCGVTTLDLPTEARWEFAARAGCGSFCSAGSIDAAIDTVAWTSDNGKKIHAVGTLAPNAFGLYDMFGNLFELCLDVYAPYVFTPGEVTVDPFALTDGKTCVGRGGGYANPRSYSGASVRVTRSPFSDGWDYGYRLCCEAVAY